MRRAILIAVQSTTLAHNPRLLCLACAGDGANFLRAVCLLALVFSSAELT